MEIFMWWLDLDLASKEWLRENLYAEELPLPVLQGIAEAGGPHPRKSRRRADRRRLGLHPDAVGVRGLTPASVNVEPAHLETLRGD